MITTFRHRLINRTYQRLSPLVKNKKAVHYFTVTFTLFSLSFFGLFAIRPTLITAVSLNKSVADLKRLNLEYEDKIGSIIRAQAEYEQIRNDLPLLNSALPTLSSFHLLAQSLETFAQRSELTISQMQIDNVPISKTASTGETLRFGFSLIVTGTYPSISSYLSHLLNWKRIVNINSLEFTQEGSTLSGGLRVGIKGTAFYEP